MAIILLSAHLRMPSSGVIQRLLFLLFFFTGMPDPIILPVHEMCNAFLLGFLYILLAYEVHMYSIHHYFYFWFLCLVCTIVPILMRLFWLLFTFVLKLFCMLSRLLKHDHLRTTLLFLLLLLCTSHYMWLQQCLLQVCCKWRLKMAARQPVDCSGSYLVISIGHVFWNALREGKVTKKENGNVFQWRSVTAPCPFEFWFFAHSVNVLSP